MMSAIASFTLQLTNVQQMAGWIPRWMDAGWLDGWVN